MKVLENNFGWQVHSGGEGHVVLGTYLYEASQQVPISSLDRNRRKCLFSTHSHGSSALSGSLKRAWHTAVIRRQYTTTKKITENPHQTSFDRGSRDLNFWPLKFGWLHTQIHVPYERATIENIGNNSKAEAMVDCGKYEYIYIWIYVYVYIYIYI